MSIKNFNKYISDYYLAYLCKLIVCLAIVLMNENAIQFFNNSLAHNSIVELVFAIMS